ncbi:hypothetical protein PHAVU_008G090900 [Phaseolus vulgaris]|uniref:UDP-glycosyltransferases domain-containing protein n=1 Tax=Phaseolus vulgaris TaxID=3885 RepID=V7B6V3_PHAVU|nr:hypothetical protein PHAVU_008G090900g [Phaseolus vulgaris]ESW12176.1 hypothetical protein PHAVU_008G090900g [Phaseolus vulgaris]
MNLMIDTTRLFARHGVNMFLAFQKAIDIDFSFGCHIRTQLVPFPAAKVGLPEGVENMKGGTSLKILHMFYPWTMESAEKLGIPRIFFYSSSYLSECAAHSIRRHRPQKRLVSDTDKFTILDFPQRIEMTRLQLANWKRVRKDVPHYLVEMEYAIYVNFGSLTRLPHAQLVELAYGLQHSGHSFIWVMRKRDEKFEDNMKESKKGFIVWNWAPQQLILNHLAIGGFVIHCGWNSILESLNAGLPIITWRMFEEQFFNERLLVDVLKIGVPVGAKENKFWAFSGKVDVAGREEIANAVVQLMEKEESRELRRRARKLSDASKKTIEKGGDSYNNLIHLIDELKSLKSLKALAKAS